MSVSKSVTWFTPAQSQLVIITERTASGLSTLGCIFVFVTFASTKRLHRPVNRLLFYSTIANLLMNAGTMISFGGMYAGRDSLLCQTQGFLIQMFLPADVLWNLAMAINTYLTVFKNYDAQRLRKLEFLYNLINFGVPFAVALACCFMSTPSRGKMYGPAILWCWLSDPWDVFRIILCYGPVWVAITACMLIYLAAGVDIYRKRNQLRKFRSRKGRGGNASSLALNLIPHSINRTTVVRTTSMIREAASDEKILATGQYHCSAEGFPKNPFREDGSPRHSQNPAMEANAAAWGYTKSAMLFFICLVITWGPSSVFRVFTVLHPEIHSFALAYAAALVLPLQGFWNAIIYIIVSWDAFKAWIKVDIWGGPTPSNPTPWLDARSMYSHNGTIRGNRLSSECMMSPASAGLNVRDGKCDVLESLYGMTRTGTPKLPPPFDHRSRSSPGLQSRASFHRPIFEQTNLNRSKSVPSAQDTSVMPLECSSSLRSSRGLSHSGRSSSAVGWRHTSIEERPGTAPELSRPSDVEFVPFKFEGLVELPTAITPREPASPAQE